jgi:Mg/Co/Ni transporter MgtE
VVTPYPRRELIVVVLLGVVVILVVGAFGMLAVMFVRDEPLLGVVGLGMLVFASVLGAWYGVVTP